MQFVSVFHLWKSVAATKYRRTFLAKCGPIWFNFVKCEILYTYTSKKKSVESIIGNFLHILKLLKTVTC